MGTYFKRRNLIGYIYLYKQGRGIFSQDKMGIKKVKVEDVKKLKGRTSKEELDKMTDSEIKQAVLADKESFIPTEEELQEFGKPKQRGRENNK